MSFFQWLGRIGVTSHPGGWAATEKLLTNLKPKKGELAIELGCGHGRTLSHVAEKFGTKVVGIDIVFPLALQACQRLIKRKAEGYAIVADICNLPFRDETFQVAWAESVFVFLPKPEAFAEVGRVLKRNGRFGIIELTWRDMPFPEYCEQTRKFMNVPRYEVLTLDQWSEAISRNGFEVRIAEKLPSHSLPSPLHQWLSDLRDLTRLGLGLALQVSFRKWFEGARDIVNLFRYTVPAIFVAVKVK
ncbi:MAG: class I SAM-dependent methyltransferase [Armatimonadetes bacterium]|nr:class I SAM-dependent methyltransferase [Armatimonadota bacterium]MDW8029156.1 class I SAM-dependent methyltransferase [Armatimonadota bacterium]